MSDLMETILLIMIPVVVVVLWMIVYHYMERKGWIKTKNVKMTKQMVELVNAILYKNLKNDDLKNKASKIHEAIVSALDFAEKFLVTTDIEKKKELVYENALKKLEILGVELDENDKEIVKIIVENLVEMMENMETK